MPPNLNVKAKKKCNELKIEKMESLKWLFTDLFSFLYIRYLFRFIIYVVLTVFFKEYCFVFSMPISFNYIHII